MKERIIRLLGGCTSEEVIESNGNSASIGRLMALYDVQDYMRQNNARVLTYGARTYGNTCTMRLKNLLTINRHGKERKDYRD